MIEILYWDSVYNFLHFFICWSMKFICSHQEVSSFQTLGNFFLLFSYFSRFTRKMEVHMNLSIGRDGLVSREENENGSAWECGRTESPINLNCGLLFWHKYALPYKGSVRAVSFNLFPPERGQNIERGPVRPLESFL